MTRWSFLTNHGRALVCIARDPEVRLREIAMSLAISERRTYTIVTDLTEAGYVVKSKEGRRNRYEIQSHLPLPEFTGREQAIGAVLDLLAAPEERRRFTRRSGDGADAGVRATPAAS
ncbi:MAG TPA: ArsR family transcriptional regulator [Acidimicrobiales bacterium]|nr:ArsR family transcriptional regulator [Acidimicrobiales bacterium]